MLSHGLDKPAVCPHSPRPTTRSLRSLSIIQINFIQVSPALAPLYQFYPDLTHPAVPLLSRHSHLVAISPQTLEHSASTAEVKGLTFPVLSDLGNQTARAYGLVYSLSDAVRRVYAEAALDLSVFNGDRSYELPIPATYVVGVDGVVKWAFIDPDFTRRPDSDQLVAAVSSISEMV